MHAQVFFLTVLTGIFTECYCSKDFLLFLQKEKISFESIGNMIKRKGTVHHAVVPANSLKASAGKENAVEIERKYLVNELPANLNSYPCLEITQAYLCTNPVIRIRQENSTFYLTCKGQGMLAREECNLSMSGDAYRKLLEKAEGTIIRKQRYVIPLENDLHAELDVFHGTWEGLVVAEVEFPDLHTANSFLPPSWLGMEVTFDARYHNSWMSSHTPEDFHSRQPV